MTLIDHLRDYLIEQGLVRAPNVAGPGARPWLPTCWRHDESGAVGPGDAKDQSRPSTQWDDGLVINLMWAPGIPPAAGAEERRIDGVDLIIRATDVPSCVAFDAAFRAAVIGTLDPGGQCDWTMAGLYVIQARQYSPFQPLDSEDEVFTFRVGYTFETRVA